MKSFLLTAVVAACAAGLPAAVAWAAHTDTDSDAAALRACRGIADAARRLACYDALPVAAVPAVPAPAAAPAPMPAPSASPSATPSATPAAAARPAPPVAVAAAVAPAAPSRPTEAEFGLEAQRAAEITQISSRINGTFEGWSANTRIRLANGQVWQVTDGTSASYYLKDPKVTVARAALGSFRLEIEGAKQAPRVRRVE